MALASLLLSTCESKRWPWSEEVDFGSFVRAETAQGCKGLARRTSATAWALTKWHGWWRLWITNYKIKSNNRPSVFTKLWKCSVSACSNVHGSSEHKSLSGDKVRIMYFDINRWTRGMKWAASLSWIAFISLTIATIPNTCSVLLRLGLSFFFVKGHFNNLTFLLQNGREWAPIKNFFFFPPPLLFMQNTFICHLVIARLSLSA